MRVKLCIYIVELKCNNNNNIKIIKFTFITVFSQIQATNEQITAFCPVAMVTLATITPPWGGVSGVMMPFSVGHISVTPKALPTLYRLRDFKSFGF